MKKLIILSFLFALSVSLMAQRSGSVTTMLPNQVYKTLTMTAADSVYSTQYWDFALNKTKTQYWSFAIRADTATKSEACHTWFTVWGSVDGTVFTNTGATTVKFAGTVDSTFAISDVSTGVLWRYLRLQAATVHTMRRSNRIGAISLKVGEK